MSHGVRGLGMGVQRYVANDLTHFVGRGMKEEEQYELMLKIIREGWLTHPPHDPNKQMELSYGPEALLSADGYAVRCVCFCDIPLADLNLHMAKYSRFGLAFSKRTMAKKGASPVFYVANDSRHLIGRPPYVDGFGTRIEEGVRRGWVDRGLVFDMFGRGVANALMAIGDLAKSSRRNEDARMSDEEYNLKLKNDLIKNL
jgi:Putative abortive phage resistance protein AbiGi, antitoxin